MSRFPFVSFSNFFFQSSTLKIPRTLEIPPRLRRIARRYTYAQANATGTFGLSDSDVQPQNSARHVSHNLTWSVSMSSPGHVQTFNYSIEDFKTNLWLGTPEGTNLNDGTNPYSACAIAFTYLPPNTINKGQHDDGTCYQTLSKVCVDALTTKAAHLGQALAGSFIRGPNGTDAIFDLGDVCSQI